MKKGDLLWGFALLIWILLLVIPVTRSATITASDAHPYIAGFIKFAILATMGDLLGIRIRHNKWIVPKGIIYRAVVWGIIGLMVTLVFTVYMGGVGAAQASGRLPFEGSVLAQAFFGSAIMNVTFGPMMMVFHRFTDMFIDTKYEKNEGPVTLRELIGKIDWNSLVEFTWLKCCPFFWIPAHTIVFLLPAEYRVLVSAFLSIALGILLAIANKEKLAKVVIAA
ncbi:hypothetical protein Desor_4407 [Desulfosporosinus orientis DSM 765]|uniref:Mpv17 / PMP22 family n=1 Tax=Desulfosporosinus orientis (strain ATCC 19365 / DSM 765 / NCIMB 8382 / VKM B-1628 / Singapore I) TaxID=768706 RepID=G7W6X0_DESOD|nr:hypothetical protein [Desulfosporosinus orientis]AET69827.1 hypothetical protein Desor_4407 [Desulfosporosinus orientis DSM 765]